MTGEGRDTTGPEVTAPDPGHDGQELREQIAAAIRDVVYDLPDTWSVKALADAVLPVVDAHTADMQARIWQEGYDAAYTMARLWGHVDHWEDEPQNPYASPDDTHQGQR